MPSLASSSRAAFRSAAPRARIATFAPEAANCRATASPRPLLPPVMAATRSFIVTCMLFSRSRSSVPLVGSARTIIMVPRAGMYQARSRAPTLPLAGVDERVNGRNIRRGSAGTSDKDFSRFPAPGMASLLFSARPCGDRQAGQDRIEPTMKSGDTMGLQQAKLELLPFVTAELNYLAPTPGKPRTYAFDPPPGEPKSTALPEPHNVPIFDARLICRQSLAGPRRFCAGPASHHRQGFLRR